MDKDAAAGDVGVGCASCDVVRGLLGSSRPPIWDVSCSYLRAGGGCARRCTCSQSKRHVLGGQCGVIKEGAMWGHWLVDNV